MYSANNNNKRLSDWAYQELTNKRGFPYRGAERFIKSLPQDEATEVSGIPFPCEAICFEGENLEVQLQPKRPFWTEAEKTRGAHTKGKKAPKYRSASKRGAERFDAILPPHPEVDQFWQRLIKAKETGDTDFLSRYCYNLDGTPSVIITEGAYKAWALHLLDLACVCLIGVEMGLTSSKEHPEGKRFLVPALERLAKAGFGFIICFDADAATKAPVRRAERKLAASLRQYGVPVESRTGYWKPEEGKGIDDTILHHGGWQAGMTEEEREECFRRGGDRFRQQILGAASPPEWLSEWQTKDLPRKHSFYQEAFDKLYLSDSDRPYIFIQNHFYQWFGTYYHKLEDELELKRIADFCDRYSVEMTDKQGTRKLEFPYASPGYPRQIWTWASQRLGVSPERINPPGLNCLDGVLKLEYCSRAESFERRLVPHSPDLLYTYPPLVSYSRAEEISADSCDRLLESLDPPQREIFLRTIGAAFDLPTVRQHKGREVRALFLAGEGSNGKDALRYAVSTLFGHQGLVSASLTDFYQYDNGRKFSLAKIEGANLCWHSENSDAALIDRIQSLKAAITGQEIDIERKGFDEYPTKPRCVFLFNINKPPRVEGTIEAIKSRYAFLQFAKVFSNHPDPTQGELLAEPRFLYDPQFVQEQVAPWLLRYSLDALDRLMAEGIDYSCTEAALEEVQEQTDHIFQFVRDTGLCYVKGATLYATEAFKRLVKWYQEQGFLEVEERDGRNKRFWNAPAGWGDRLVKGLNQIFPRLLKLFKKVKRRRDSQGRYFLEGLAFSEDGLNQSEDGLKMVNSLRDNDSERTEADFSNLEQVVSFIKRMGDESKKQLLKSLGLENNVHHLQKADSQKNRVDSGHMQTASVVDSAIDYASFPALKSDDLRHKQKRAIACRQRLLECQTRAQLEHFREVGEFTSTEIEWVVGHLNVQERAALEEIGRIEQLTLESAVGDLEAPQPTLQELQALLLACQTLAQLKEFKQKYPQGGKEAYCTLSAQQQRQIDAVAAQAVPHDVYKYMGKRIEQNDQTLKTGTLVYIDPNAKANRTVGHVFVWLLRGVELGWRCAIAVSRDCLELVKEAAAVGSNNLPGSLELPGLEGG